MLKGCKFIPLTQHLIATEQDQKVMKIKLILYCYVLLELIIFHHFTYKHEILTIPDTNYTHQNAPGLPWTDLCKEVGTIQIQERR